MSFFRNILHDLVEKRLWPVALLLCAALVAVPTVLKKSAEVPAATPAPSTATLADASVVASEAPARSRLDVGKERNPFQSNDPAKPKSGSDGTTAPEATGSEPVQGSSGTTPAGSGGGGGGSTGGGTTPVPTPDPTPIPDPPAPGEMAWTLDVNFGKDGETKPIKAVLPGRALPSTADPVLIYLAAVDGGAGARFIVSSDARAQGDGTCKPSVKTCTIITLMKGDTAFFDVAKGETTTQYELELVDVVKREVEE